MIARQGADATPWSVLARFLRADPAAGAYLLARCAGFPHFSRVERALPAEGAILDVGCGHGLLAVLAGSRAPERRILGIDRLAGRIATGREVVMRAGLDNVRLEVGRIEALPAGPFAAIALVDVLMYLPLETQGAVLADCRRRLAPGGRLVIKEQLLRPRWKARLVGLQEALVVGLKTRSERGAAWREIAATGIHLWEEESLLALLVRLGLSVHSRALHDWSYLSHHLIIGAAASSTQASAPARLDGRDRERPSRTAA